MSVNSITVKSTRRQEAEIPGKFFLNQTTILINFVGFFSPIILFQYIARFRYEFVNLKNYLAAIFVLTITFIIIQFSGSFVELHPYFFLTAPVIINALYGGLGPALLSIFVGVLIANLITNGFNSGINIFQLNPTNVIFIIEGLIISWISINQKRKHQASSLNLTQSQNARARAQNTNTTLRKLERQKDDFIAIAAHELKNPLASMKAFSQILELKTADLQDAQLNQYVIKMEEQTERLEQLVAQLFDVSSISNGKTQLRKKIVNFDECVLSTIIDLQHTISTHKLIVQGHTKADVSLDPQKIQQVLVNLVSNAVKYSPNADKVIIQLSADKNRVMLSVTDFGAGIELEDQKRIFQRFYRINSIQTSGLGLGLYLASEIVKLHLGKMWVKSDLGKGSTFFFSLPKQPGVGQGWEV